MKISRADRQASRDPQKVHVIADFMVTAHRLKRFG